MKSIILLLFLFLAPPARAGGEDLQIWYIPFNVHTDKPITRKNIDKGPIVTLMLYSTCDLEPIKSMLSKGSVPPSELHIRLKLIIHKSIYFFDAKGNGISNAGELVKIDKEKFENAFSYSRILVDLGKEED